MSLALADCDGGRFFFFGCLVFGKCTALVYFWWCVCMCG